MFIDEAVIEVRAGDGGDGKVSFHTAKYIPNGGPDGGDGGRGGDVVFVADSGLSTLQDFRYRRKYLAENGSPGGTSNKNGKSGVDLLIRVPQGTLVRDAETRRILADLTEDGQQAVIARGGRGGRGNVHFANSVRQAPRFARAGEPGEVFNLQIELKLLADAALIGFPNVGKSTLLASVSAARPKIADYPFTTIEPVLGVVAVDDSHFVLADIPGLIEGAHTGLGLGLSFLKHIERTRLLIHVLDASGHAGRDPYDDYEKVNRELQAYDPALSERPQVVALNMIDITEPDELGELQARLQGEGRAVFPVCAPTGQGVKPLIQHVAAKIRSLPPPVLRELVAAQTLYQFSEPLPFQIERLDGIWRVRGEWIENLVRSTNFDDHESLQYFQRQIRKKGLNDELKKAGAREGDTVALLDMTFDFIE